MEMTTYQNTLANHTFRRYNTYYCKQLGLPTSNPDNVQEAFEKVLADYAEYIHSPDKVKEIFQRMETIQYINGGYIPEKEWAHNFHILIINGEKFEYKTGMGIDCQPNKKLGIYNYYKLFLDAVYCFLRDAWTAINYSEDDFISEFGYDTDVSTYKKGVVAYQLCRESAKKCVDIWGHDIVNNLYDIIQL